MTHWDIQDSLLCGLGSVLATGALVYTPKPAISSIPVIRVNVTFTKNPPIDLMDTRPFPVLDTGSSMFWALFLRRLMVGIYWSVLSYSLAILSQRYYPLSLLPVSSLPYMVSSPILVIQTQFQQIVVRLSPPDPSAHSVLPTISIIAWLPPINQNGLVL
jgi:hypothetical protein